MSVKKLPQKTFNRIYRKVPRLCVDMVVKDRRGVVLIRRDIEPAKGKWHFPGGTILYGENILRAMQRIAKEETGLSVSIEKFLGYIEFSRRSAYGQTVSLVFLVRPFSGRLRGSRQGKEVQFFRSIPGNTLLEHRNFLIRSRLMRNR